MGHGPLGQILKLGLFLHLLLKKYKEKSLCWIYRGGLFVQRNWGLEAARLLIRNWNSTGKQVVTPIMCVKSYTLYPHPPSQQSSVFHRQKEKFHPKATVCQGIRSASAQNYSSGFSSLSPTLAFLLAHGVRDQAEILLGFCFVSERERPIWLRIGALVVGKRPIVVGKPSLVLRVVLVFVAVGFVLAKQAIKSPPKKVVVIVPTTLHSPLSAWCCCTWFCTLLGGRDFSCLCYCMESILFIIGAEYLTANYC